MATNPAEAPDYATIVRTVRSWSEAERFALVQTLLATLDPRERVPRQKTLERAVGLLATDKPPPTDAEVEEMLEERRHERFGL